MTTALLARCPAPVAPLPPRGSGPTLPLSVPKTLPFSMPKTLPFSMPIDTTFVAKNAPISLPNVTFPGFSELTLQANRRGANAPPRK